MLEEYLDYDSGEKIFNLIGILHGGIESCDNSVYPGLFNRVAAPENHQWILNFATGNIDILLHNGIEQGLLELGHIYPSKDPNFHFF